MKRLLTVGQMLDKKFITKTIEDPQWSGTLGKEVELTGVWIIWGQSGNGKTNFTLQLAKYLSTFDRVVYDTLEEGARQSFKRAVKLVDMKACAKSFYILDRENMEDLRERLIKRRSPRIIIIDSFQFSGLTKKTYKALKEDFPDKLFIFISHAEGKNPEGRTAKYVRYDADIKILVEGYKAFPTSRYGGTIPYTIWKKGAIDYWGDKV